jgi:hypothetical protein
MTVRDIYGRLKVKDGIPYLGIVLGTIKDTKATRTRQNPPDRLKFRHS